jgi:hypothetical protein
MVQDCEHSLWPLWSYVQCNIWLSSGGDTDRIRNILSDFTFLFLAGNRNGQEGIMTDNESQRSPVYRFFQPIGELRDALLVLTSGLYVLGYLTWTSYALENNLGLLPVLDVQYFAAGLVPLFVLLLFYSYGRATLHLNKRIRSWVEIAGNHRLAGPLSMLLGVASLVPLWYFFKPRTLFMQALVQGSFLILVTLSALLMLNFAAVDPREKREQKSRIRRVLGELILMPAKLGVAFGVLIIAGGALGYLLLYYHFQFPHIPQELGGARPRCAQVDVTRDRLTRETLESIIPAGGLSDDSEVLRTARLDVYFSGSNFMLVRPQGAKENAKTDLFQVRDGAINAVFWCDE